MVPNILLHWQRQIQVVAANFASLMVMRPSYRAPHSGPVGGNREKKKNWKIHINIGFPET